MLTDIEISVTGLSSDCVTNWSLRSHHSVKASLHYLVKHLCSKIDLISTLIHTGCRLYIVNLMNRILGIFRHLKWFGYIGLHCDVTLSFSPCDTMQVRRYA